MKCVTITEFVDRWNNNKLPRKLYETVIDIVGERTGYNPETEPIITKVTSLLPKNRDFSTMEFLYKVLDGADHYWELSEYY